MDTCTTQNKNWTRSTAMVDIINSDKIAVNVITFKYVEGGRQHLCLLKEENKMNGL